MEGKYIIVLYLVFMKGGTLYGFQRPTDFTFLHFFPTLDFVAIARAARDARRAQAMAEAEAKETAELARTWEEKYHKELRKSINLQSRLASYEARSRLYVSNGHPVLPERRYVVKRSRRSTFPFAHSAVSPKIGQGDNNQFFDQVSMMQHQERLSSNSFDSHQGGLSISAVSNALAALVLLQTARQKPDTCPAARLGRQDSDTAGLATVSVADDGRSGVGPTAAAIVSVALAQSWAAVADADGCQSNQSRGPLPEAAACVHPGRARFKLVAAIPRPMQQKRGLTGSTPSPSKQGVAGTTGPTNPASSKETNDPLSFDGGFDDGAWVDTSEDATWRASGSHLKMHWLTAPTAVLIVYKPTEDVVQAVGPVVAWLLNKGIAVYAEPRAYRALKLSAAAALGVTGAALAKDLASGGGDDATESVSLSGDSPSRKHYDQPTDMLENLIMTWQPGEASCDDLVPVRIANKVDIVLTLGGDGTVLWGCSLFGKGPVPPIVPMALGSLGFMTPFPMSRLEAVLSRVVSTSHGFPLQLRHRLRCRILRSCGESTVDLASASMSSMEGSCEDEGLVLNEVVIDRGMTSSLANLQCYVDKNFVTSIQGDGLIIATPTGSTAYNLAAGGSMVHPSVPCILFTPICAHTLSSRPLVFPEHVTLRVQVPIDSRAEAYCSFDGRGRRILNPGDSVLVHVSQWPVPMVCNLDASHDWFLSVREGLNWNRRVPQKPV